MISNTFNSIIVNSQLYGSLEDAAYGSNEQLKEAFSKFEFKITKQHLYQLEKICIAYELRGDNPKVLNSAALGLYPMYFLPADQQNLFNIFGVDRMDIEELINDCDSIDKNFKVVSDAYNIFSVWLLHRALYSNELNMSEKDQFMMIICKLLQYKFFTSLVAHNFPYGADKAVMDYTNDNLSGKFAIKQPGINTWKLVIEARSKDIIDKRSIHYNTIKTFGPDNKPAGKEGGITYLISDVQTRLRLKLRGIVDLYYQNKEEQNRIGSYNLVNDIDGEKLIKNLSATYDVMTSSICSQVLVANRFINYEYIKLVCKFNTSVRPDLLKLVLSKFSILASLQNSKNEQDKVVMSKTNKSKVEYLEGYRILLTDLIQFTYAAILQDNKIKINSKLAILEKVMDIYRSSRIQNEGIQLVKSSIDRFVLIHGDTKRDATRTALKIGIILYIILLTFDYL